MKTTKTAGLTGAALDWAVAKCEGGWILELAYFLPNHSLGRMNFSTDWAQGGPIIEREHLEFDFREDTQDYACFDGYRAATGPTHLIAAMRCYVASKLGDEVDVPEELL